LIWTYNNREFTGDGIGEYFGMVYLITNIRTGRKYVGKKFFTKAARRQVKGKPKKVRIASDWEKYFGSNKVIQEEVKTLGEDVFKREILHLCKSRSECSYWETWEIFNRDALRTDDYYNDWVSCRIRKAHLLSNRTPAMYKTKMRRPASHR
jgi:hypothetical protein